MRAVQLATINPAEYFKLSGLGAIAPGYIANLIVLDDLRQFRVDMVFHEADLIVENKFSTARMVHCQLEPYNSYAYVESDGTLTIWSSIHRLSTSIS